MIDSQYIFPATLSALTILATVLNFTAHFSNGEYLSWKAFNRISLATLLSMTVCIFAWMIHSRAGMLSSLQLVENNLGNMALLLLGSMFVVYQEFILFKNVLSWIGRKALPGFKLFLIRYSCSIGSDNYQNPIQQSTGYVSQE